MIKYVEGNIFESPAKVLVNPVNTVGVMGKGLAQKFKQIYPDMFSQYQKFCENNQFDIGNLYLFKTSNKWVLNFPTKKNWRSKSTIEYLEKGLQKFVDKYEEKGITSIAFPKLGCGNGGLNWRDQVLPLMESYLSELDIDIYIYIANYNNPKPEFEDINTIKNWLRERPRELSFYELNNDLKELFNNKAITVNGKRYYMNWNTDYISINSNETISLEGLKYLWQNVRKIGYISKDDFLIEASLFQKEIIFHMLEHLDYMRPMLIHDQGVSKSLSYVPPSGKTAQYVSAEMNHDTA